MHASVHLTALLFSMLGLFAESQGQLCLACPFHLVYMLRLSAVHPCVPCPLFLLGSAQLQEEVRLQCYYSSALRPKTFSYSIGKSQQIRVNQSSQIRSREDRETQCPCLSYIEIEVIKHLDSSLGKKGSIWLTLSHHSPSS